MKHAYTFPKCPGSTACNTSNSNLCNQLFDIKFARPVDSDVAKRFGIYKNTMSDRASTETKFMKC